MVQGIMFKTITEVIEHWRRQFAETNMPEYRVTSPGYENSDLEILEKHLGMSIHKDFKKLLGEVNLDSVTFGNIFFSYRNKNYLDVLKECNPMKDVHLPNRFLQVASTDGSLILLDNEDGSVYVAEHMILEPTKIASSIDEFFRIAATIVETEWPGQLGIDNDGEEYWEDNDETLAAIDKFLNEHSITLEPDFWRGLVLGWN
jgi:hypothetical protein